MSDLHDDAGGARRTDPRTSKEAAVTIRAGGKRELALRAFLRAGADGLTNGELEEQTGQPGIWKRTSELEQGGYIRADGRERRNRDTGKMNRVYVATTAGASALGATPAPALIGEPGKAPSMYDPTSDYA